MIFCLVNRSLHVGDNERLIRCTHARLWEGVDGRHAELRLQHMSLSTRENQVQARESMLIARETAVTEREARLLERENRIVTKEKWAAELHEREKLIHERERIIHDREQRLERLQLQRDDKMDIETFNAKHGNQSHWHRLTFSIRTISSITPSTTSPGKQVPPYLSFFSN
jgi:hypothetical protein